MDNYRTKKRVPIRRRVLLSVLVTTVITAFAAMTSNMVAMLQIKKESEETLTYQLKQNLRSLVEQKAKNTDLRLEHYENFIVFLTDYIQNMYKNRDNLIATGKYIDAPRLSTPKGAFAMSGILATENMKPEDVHDDIMFFSHLEKAWKPIAEENDGLIDTVYVGIKSGFLPAYDKYSYLTAVADMTKYLYYNFFESEWYKKGMKTDRVFYTELYKDSQGRGLTITIGKGFNDANGVRQGVCCADFNLTGLYTEMLGLYFGAGATSFAFAADGKIISEEEIDASSTTGLSGDEIKSILKEKNGILEKNDAFYVYAPIKRVGWTLCARVPKNIVLESLNVMDRTIWTAILASIGGLALITLIVVLIADKLAASITRPMEQLGEDMEVIGQGNLEHKAAISRNDEVGDIAMQLNIMVDKLKHANISLKNSQQRAEEMTELATKDPLTGIRNRAAYDKEIQQLQWSIRDGLKDFGIVMVDMNFLKRTNDIYGHEKGNIAIKKLCEIVCNIFVHSPVFRIGGDEFVVVLTGRDFEHADALISEFNAQIQALQQDKTLEPWARVSAAIGYATFNPQTDSSIENVFRRADKAMYARKKAMKAVRTE